MSLPSLITSLESVLSLSAKSLESAEEAVVQARGCLEAAKKALELLNNSEEKPEPSDVVEQVAELVNVKHGNVEIVDVDSYDEECPLTNIQYGREDLLALQSSPLSKKKPVNLPLCIIKDFPHNFTFTALASSEPAQNTSFLKRNYLRCFTGRAQLGRIVWWV